jgi:hypothetical protein
MGLGPTAFSDYFVEKSLVDITVCLGNVRFTPNSGHPSAQSKCPLWAKNGLMQCSKVASYLIALAAVADIFHPL